jgi:hypothetical protein
MESRKGKSSALNMSKRVNLRPDNEVVEFLNKNYNINSRIDNGRRKYKVEIEYDSIPFDRNLDYFTTYITGDIKQNIDVVTERKGEKNNLVLRTYSNDYKKIIQRALIAIERILSEYYMKLMYTYRHYFKEDGDDKIKIVIFTLNDGCKFDSSKLNMEFCTLNINDNEVKIQFNPLRFSITNIYIILVDLKRNDCVKELEQKQESKKKSSTKKQEHEQEQEIIGLVTFQNNEYPIFRMEDTRFETYGITTYHTLLLPMDKTATNIDNFLSQHYSHYYYYSNITDSNKIFFSFFKKKSDEADSDVLQRIKDFVMLFDIYLCSELKDISLPDSAINVEKALYCGCKQYDRTKNAGDKQAFFNIEFDKEYCGSQKGGSRKKKKVRSIKTKKVKQTKRK